MTLTAAIVLVYLYLLLRNSFRNCQTPLNGHRLRTFLYNTTNGQGHNKWDVVQHVRSWWNLLYNILLSSCKYFGPNSTTRTPATDKLFITPPSDKSQQFYNLPYNKFTTSQCQSPTSRHVKMLGCGKFSSVSGEFVVQQVVELLWACRLVVSVGGVVQHVRWRCPCSGVWHKAKKRCSRRALTRDLTVF